MNSPTPYRVGSYLVDSSQIYSIYKVADDRLYYRPAVKIDQHPSIIGSIPKDNVELAGFRSVLTKEEIDKFFTSLAKTKAPSEVYDAKMTKEILISNDPFKVIPLLRQLHRIKSKGETDFTSTNRDTLEDILSHLSIEFSLSTKKSIESIRKKILLTLGK